jgi:hypothetical protein
VTSALITSLTFASVEAQEEFDEGFDLLAEMRERGLLGSLEPELDDTMGQDVLVSVLNGEIAVRQSKAVM